MVVGASRGIGRAIVNELIAAGRTVVATARMLEGVSDLAQEEMPGRAIPVGLDVTNVDSIKQAAVEVSQQIGGVDHLIICAGATHDPDFPQPYSKGPLPQLAGDAMVAVFRTNAMGSALVVQQFMPLLTRSDHSPRIMCISSDRGSLSMTDSPGSISYAMAKAALNMFVKKVSAWPGRGRASIFAVHPGWVATDLGGFEAPTAPRDAARNLLALLSDADHQLNGRFVDTAGIDISW